MLRWLLMQLEGNLQEMFKLLKPMPLQLKPTKCCLKPARLLRKFELLVDTTTLAAWKVALEKENPKERWSKARAKTFEKGRWDHASSVAVLTTHSSFALTGFRETKIHQRDLQKDLLQAQKGKPTSPPMTASTCPRGRFMSSPHRTVKSFNQLLIEAPKVVLDTGVTESLAFEIDQGFVLAMGRCSKLSQSWCWDTPSFGEVAFYLLHGSAENTPLPLGARDLCQRQALIAYKGEYMAHKNALGEWRASPLTQLEKWTPGLAPVWAVCEPLNTCEASWATWPWTWWPTWWRRRWSWRSSSRWWWRRWWRLWQTKENKIRSNSEVWPKNLTALRACECCGASNSWWDPRKKPALFHRPWLLWWHPMQRHPMQRSRNITFEPNLRGRHATSDAWWLWAWVTTWKTFWTWSFWVAQCFFYHISRVTRCWKMRVQAAIAAGIVDEATGTWMSAVPEESRESESHEHDDGQVRHVMMVMPEDVQPPLADRISSLAQRLQALQSELNLPKHEHSFKAMLPCDSNGPSSPRLAMRRDASSRTNETEQVRGMPARDAIFVPATWPRGRTREKPELWGQRQAHGDTWTWFGSQWWSWQNNCDGQGRRASSQTPDGRHWHDRAWHGIYDYASYANNSNYADYYNSSARDSRRAAGVQPRAEDTSDHYPASKAKAKPAPKALQRVKMEPVEPPVEPAAAASTPAEGPPKEIPTFEVDDVLTISSEGESWALCGSHGKAWRERMSSGDGTPGCPNLGWRLNLWTNLTTSTLPTQTTITRNLTAPWSTTLRTALELKLETISWAQQLRRPLKVSRLPQMWPRRWSALFRHGDMWPVHCPFNRPGRARDQRHGKGTCVACRVAVYPQFPCCKGRSFRPLLCNAAWLIAIPKLQRINRTTLKVKYSYYIPVEIFVTKSEASGPLQNGFWLPFCAKILTLGFAIL